MTIQSLASSRLRKTIETWRLLHRRSAAKSIQQSVRMSLARDTSLDQCSDSVDGKCIDYGYWKDIGALFGCVRRAVKILTNVRRPAVPPQQWNLQHSDPA